MLKISYEDFIDYKNFCSKYMTDIYIKYRNNKTNKQILLTKDSIAVYNGKAEEKGLQDKVNNLISNKDVSILYDTDNGCLYTFFKNKNLAQYFEEQMKNVYNLHDLQNLIKFIEVTTNIKNKNTLQTKKKYNESIYEIVLNKILLKRYNKNIDYSSNNSSRVKIIHNRKNTNLKDGEKIKSFKFKNQDLFLEIGSYTYSNNLAVMCNTADDLYGVITINLPGMYLESKDEAFIDPINKDCGLLQKLIDEGIVKKVIKKNVQYNMGKYDLVQFNMDKLKEYDPKGYERFLKEIGFDEDISFKPSI